MGWYWCLHCERVYRVAKGEEGRGSWRCHYHDCDGGIGDAFDWEEIRRNVPVYPVVPVEGVMYPQYGRCGSWGGGRGCRRCYYWRECRSGVASAGQTARCASKCESGAEVLTNARSRSSPSSR